jgi:hypothetical protein
MEFYSTPPYLSMACYLIEPRDNFAFNGKVEVVDVI